MAEYCDIVDEQWSIADDLHMHLKAPLGDSLTIGSALPRSGMRTPYTETGTLGDYISGHYVSLIAEGLTVGEVIGSVTNGRNTITEHLRVRDRLPQILRGIIDETATLGDLVRDSGILRDRILEAATLGDNLPLVQHVANIIVDGLRVGDRISDRPRSVIAETLAIADVADGIIAAIDAIAETLTVHGALGGGSRQRGVLSSQAQFGDAIGSKTTGKDVVMEALTIGDAITDPAVPRIPGHAWTAGTDLFGMSEYAGFRFASFAVVAGKLLATNDDGAYAIDADNDDGLVINAAFMGDLTDEIDGQRGPESSPQLRKPHHAWFSYTTNGRLNYVLGNTGSGEEVTYRYEIDPRPALKLTTGRVGLGRGLRFRYSRHGFENVAGAAFGINDAKVHYDMLKRRA